MAGSLPLPACQDVPHRTSSCCTRDSCRYLATYTQNPANSVLTARTPACCFALSLCLFPCMFPLSPSHAAQVLAGADWADLGDGRWLCTGCLATLVPDTKECQPLYDEVLEFYASMGMKLPARPPMMLVDKGALNEAGRRGFEGRCAGGLLACSAGLGFGQKGERLLLFYNHI